MKPITYPARPISGGDYIKSAVKHGRWHYEPKFNGWRMLIHTSTGTAFNRMGHPISIAAEFQKALEALRSCPFPWLDCEGLERRHTIGHGTLIVLDAPTSSAPYVERRAGLEAAFPTMRADVQPSRDSVLLTRTYPDSGPINPVEVWTLLKRINREWLCPFYEGLVAKRSDSHYPIQLRSPLEEFPFWVKHRWQF